MSVQVALRIASHLLGGDGLAWVTIFGFFPNWAGPYLDLVQLGQVQGPAVPFYYGLLGLFELDSLNWLALNGPFNDWFGSLLNSVLLPLIFRLILDPFDSPSSDLAPFAWLGSYWDGSRCYLIDSVSLNMTGPDLKYDLLKSAHPLLHRLWKVGTSRALSGNGGNWKITCWWYLPLHPHALSPS